MRSSGRLIALFLSMLFVSACCGAAYAQSPAAPADQSGDGVLAVVNGTHVIREKDLDVLIGPEIQELRERIKALRRHTVESLIDAILLGEEARKKGMTVDQLKNSMVPEKVEVDEAQVESAFRMRPPVDPSKAEEVKTQIRRGLEIRMKEELFKQALARLRREAKVEVFLDDKPAGSIQVSDSGPSKGPANAPVTIVEFADFQCPYCRQETATLDQLLRAYDGKVRLVFKQLPLPSHPRAFRAAEASVCAEDQGKFWQYHDKMFASGDLSETALRHYGEEVGLNSASFGKCLDQDGGKDSVLRDMREAQSAGVRMTPTFVVNGKVLGGLTSLEALKKEVEAGLTQTKQVARTH